MSGMIRPTAAASAPVVAPPGSPHLRPATVRQSEGQGTVRLAAAGRPVAEDVSLRARTVRLRRAGEMPVDVSALNAAPPPRQWVEELDVREQWARQSAARRYE